MLDGLSPPLRNHTDTVTHQRRNSYDVISFQELLYKNELCNTVTTEMKSEITVGQTDLLPISRRPLFKVPSKTFCKSTIHLGSSCGPRGFCRDFPGLEKRG